ncbi:MAG: hypothetical protein ACI8RD_013552, partial [Bacillariaceae sp.]
MRKSIREQLDHNFIWKEIRISPNINYTTQYVQRCTCQAINVLVQYSYRFFFF